MTLLLLTIPLMLLAIAIAVVPLFVALRADERLTADELAHCSALDTADDELRTAA